MNTDLESNRQLSVWRVRVKRISMARRGVVKADGCVNGKWSCAGLAGEKYEYNGVRLHSYLTTLLEFSNHATGGTAVSHRPMCSAGRAVLTGSSCRPIQHLSLLGEF